MDEYLCACEAASVVERHAVTILGIFPIHSCMNHSHAPNACLSRLKTTAGPSVCFVALLPIAAGDAICISYGVWEHDITSWGVGRCLCDACLTPFAAGVRAAFAAWQRTLAVLRCIAADYRQCYRALPAECRALLVEAAGGTTDCWQCAAQEMAQWCRGWLAKHLRGQSTYLPALCLLCPVLTTWGVPEPLPDALVTLCLPELACLAPDAEARYGAGPSGVASRMAALAERHGAHDVPWPAAREVEALAPAAMAQLRAAPQRPLLEGLRCAMFWKLVWDAWKHLLWRGWEYRPAPLVPHGDVLEYWEHGL